MEVEERVPCEGGWEISLWNSWEKIIQCSLDYTEKYHLDYTENKAHSLGVRKTVGVLSHKLSKPLMTFILTSNYIPQANVVQPFINKKGN